MLDDSTAGKFYILYFIFYILYFIFYILYFIFLFISVSLS